MISDDELKEYRVVIANSKASWGVRFRANMMANEIERLRAENVAATAVNAELYKIEDGYKAKLAKARAALEFYAGESRSVARRVAVQDSGERARQALEEIDNGSRMP